MPRGKNDKTAVVSFGAYKAKGRFKRDVHKVMKELDSKRIKSQAPKAQSNWEMDYCGVEL